jgi:hypothetical protein
LILLLLSQNTPLHCSTANGRLEVSCLLVESKAEIAAKTRCFILPPSHHLSLTICLEVVVGTPHLGLAIHFNEADVAAYLRSIGAPE